MTSRLRVAARLRARLVGEVRVHGLRAPARARWSGESWELTLQDPEDDALVAGFAEAERTLGAFDFARRLWAGRLGEVYGAASLPGEPTLDLGDVDVFLRLLGLAESAAAVVRQLAPPTRHRLDAFAAGMNAFIDAGRWRGRAPWKGLASRPRLVGAGDLVLVGGAAAVIDGLGAPAAGELPATLAEGLARRIALVQTGVLRAIGAPGQPQVPGLFPPTPPLPPTVGPPSLQREEVLPGGDDHRIAHGDHWVRLSVRRPTVTLRGGAARRPWLRTGPRGPLISDVLARAESTRPPVGEAFSWTPGRGPHPASRGPGEPAAPPDAPRVPPDPAPADLRLVPLRDGA